MVDLSVPLTILMFWAGICFTSFVGVITMLPEIESWSDYSSVQYYIFYQGALSALYFGLLALVLFSSFKFVRYYNLGKVDSPELDFIKSKTSLWGIYIILSVIIVILFTILFLFKAGFVS